MDVMPMNETGERVERRRTLVELIKETYPEKTGSLFFVAAFEQERHQFYQDSTFEYFFGLQESALLIYQEIDGKTVLFEPNYSVDRSVWLPVNFDESDLSELAIDAVEKLGQTIKGYSTGPFFTPEQLENFIKKIQDQLDAGHFIFTALTDIFPECAWVVNQLCVFIPGLKEQLIDIAPLIAELRRTKSQKELEYLYHASEITVMAQQAAAGIIRKDNLEADVQAAIEYVFTESGATRAFASVVGAGKNSTTLHYVDNKDPLPEKGLVVVDIGASFNHYCSDVTRTYPVSGTFSERQRKVYQDVLDTQEYIAGIAKPGMFMRNKNEPEKCLNTLSKKFLAQRGYNVEKEFPHGIGHYVGLDVHDVGSYETPIQAGDIITIEPGLYLKDEEIGIRIEDIYWVIKDGIVCLSEGVPKKPEEIQKYMKESRFEDESESYRAGPNEH